MNKLKNNTFTLLVVILTIFSLTLFIIINSVSYNSTYKELEDKLKRITNIQDKFNPLKENNNPLFMDLDVYVILFDNKYNIKKVINYTYDNKTETEIISLLNKGYSKYKENKINNLYTNKYLYYMNNNTLFIINNTRINNRLKYILNTSIILFIILEIIIIYSANTLTKWLTKPVKDTFEKQKQFICDASHELKTPLAVIIASTETLEQDLNNNKWLNIIKEETIRMNKLVIDLLDLTRTDSINEQPIYEEINLSKLIEMTTLKFESIIYENNLEIEYNISPNLKYKCDTERIKQLIGILIDNAIKHSLEKSKIKVLLYKEKDNIILKVINRGEEIPKEERDLIFERFYRSDKARTREKNRYGLGLAIAKNIVINHNSTIRVECLNGYTTFIVKFK